MDAFYLGKPNSSMGIFQKNMILNLIKNPELEELHIVSSQDFPRSSDCEKCSVHLTEESFSRRGLYMARLNKSLGPDATFYTFNLIPPMSGKYEKIRVLQNHDWSHSQFGETVKEKFWGTVYEKIHKRSVFKATINLSNSNFTRQETRRYSNADSVIVYLDADPFYKEREFLSLPSNLNPSLQPSEYIIYAGRVYPKYKNISSLLKAFQKLQLDYKSLKLVIVHSDPFRPEDEELIRKIGSAIVSIKGISKPGLKSLYQNSLGLVYPSIYEGFGFPILEAQNSGTPVVAYNREPMTEAGGEGAIYFENGWIDMKDKISMLIDDSNLRKSAVQKGLKNVERFSWKFTADRLVEAIKNYN